MDIQAYKIPESLKRYLTESKTINEKLNESILEAIEENYIRLSSFYDFNEEEFGEITTDCLFRYKATETFGWFLSQNLKEKMKMNIKGQEKLIAYDDLNSILNKYFKDCIEYCLHNDFKFFSPNEEYRFDFENYVNAMDLFQIALVIISIKKNLGLPYEVNEKIVRSNEMRNSIKKMISNQVLFSEEVKKMETDYKKNQPIESLKQEEQES